MNDITILIIEDEPKINRIVPNTAGISAVKELVSIYPHNDIVNNAIELTVLNF